MANDFILGTAGHIDHGKTSLIRALTGTDTDRLPEEKKRGITIELGYAHLELGEHRFGIVDVPGHEKFVRQMLSGATGMDIVMLIVAADDSINQQTREHFDILRMLEMPAGLIAITKCDMVDPDWLDLVEEEVRTFVEGSFLEQAPIIRTSSHKLTGIDELKEAVTCAADKVLSLREADTDDTPFRMAIDRCFTIDGHGTVITGSVSSGSISLGDQVVVEPGATSVRIRGLQNHDSQVESIRRGQRAAINLGGIHHDEIARGQELCSPGHLAPSTLCTLWFRLLPDAIRPLKDRQKVRFHVGTTEIMGNIRLLDRKQLEPGASAAIQIFLTEPCVSVWGQPFVIRSESPVVTIGGGRILDPNAFPLKKPNENDLHFVSLLASTNARERIEASAYFGQGKWNEKDLPRLVGVSDYREIVQGLIEQKTLTRISLSHTRELVIHCKTIERIAQSVLATLEKLHRQNPLLWSIPKAELKSLFSYLNHEDLFNEAVKFLRSQKKIRLDPDSIGLEGHGPKLSRNEQTLMQKMVQVIREAEMAPPSLKQLKQQADKLAGSVPQLLDLGCQSGQLEKVSNEYFFHRETIEQIKETLLEPLAANGLTMSEIRQVLDTSRKYAVPLCEYLDAVGFTERREDLRFLKQPQSAEKGSIE